MEENLRSSKSFVKNTVTILKNYEVKDEPIAKTSHGIAEFFIGFKSTVFYNKFYLNPMQKSTVM